MKSKALFMIITSTMVTPPAEIAQSTKIIRKPLDYWISLFWATLRPPPSSPQTVRQAPTLRFLWPLHIYEGASKLVTPSC